MPSTASTSNLDDLKAAWLSLISNAISNVQTMSSSYSPAEVFSRFLPFRSVSLPTWRRLKRISLSPTVHRYKDLL